MPIECVKMVYNAFGWVEAKFGLTDLDELCKVVYDEKITWDRLKKQSKLPDFVCTPFDHSKSHRE